MRFAPVHQYFYEKSRQKLVRHLPGHALAIVVSNDEMPRTGDQFYPFRQSSDFLYLTGIWQPKSILCLMPDQSNASLRELLFIETASEKKIIWTGNTLTANAAAEISGIKHVHSIDDFETLLQKLMKEAKHVLLAINETQNDKTGPELKDMRFLKELQSHFPLHQYGALSPLLAQLRQTKEPEELAQIKKAIEITANTFTLFAPKVKPGIMEYEVEAEIIAGFLRQGAQGHAFEPIIASGANACTLHYTHNSSQVKAGDLLLIDFGAEYGAYNADITRCLPVSGKFNVRQHAVYNAVLRLHHKAASLMVCGTTLENINLAMVKFFEEELTGLGLLSVNDIKHQNPEKPLYKKYFMHGIGHFLGLDVHDVGSKQEKLMPGMVVTCEPGIYISDEGLGIRIENDFLITENGAVNLSASIPFEADEIEALMAG